MFKPSETFVFISSIHESIREHGGLVATRMPMYSRWVLRIIATSVYSEGGRRELLEDIGQEPCAAEPEDRCANRFLRSTVADCNLDQGFNVVVGWGDSQRWPAKAGRDQLFTCLRCILLYHFSLKRVKRAV